MADDTIDIEEHDVMENPIIKKIFPDLSILKKEIDYNGDFEEVTNLETQTEATENLSHRNSKKKILHTSLNSKTSFNNNIILGSKVNKNKILTKRKMKYNLEHNVKVSLSNIEPELMRSQKFCQICLILFSKKEDLYNHRISYHTDTDCVKESYKQIHSLNTNEAVFLSEDRIREINAMVKINESNAAGTAKSSTKTCFHCSFVFSSWRLLIEHLYVVLKNKNSKFQTTKTSIVKYTKKYEILQNASDNINRKKLYLSCPFCSYYFQTGKMYKEHLSSKHDIIIRHDHTNRFKFDPKCKFCHLKYYSVFSYNNHILKKHTNKMVEKKTNNICTLITDKYNNKYSKSVILSNKKKNYLQNDTFTGNTTDGLAEENVDIVMKEASVLASQVIIFKCAICNVHFLTSDIARNHSEHSEILQNWQCPQCQKLFKQEQKTLHEKQHECSSYFTVVEIESDYKFLCKTPENIVEIDDQSNFEQEKFETDSTVSIQIETDQEISQQETISDFITIETEESDKNRRENDALTKSPTDVYFCSDCKCNISSDCDLDEHLRTPCESFVKYICSLCGLVLTNDSKDSHTELHEKYKNIQLQDFTFYDLKTKIKINPVSNLLPKCKTCEKHFIYNYELVQHFCHNDDYVICSICNIKLTDSAYKLHEPFHSYQLNYQNDCGEELSRSDSATEVMEDDLNKQSNFTSEILYLYTCLNCNISMDIYDDAIEHCHSHIHLNKIEIVALKCTICNVNLITSNYYRHKQLHSFYSKEKFKCFDFDVSYFNLNNDTWLNYVFGKLPTDTINKIIEKSIYRYENKIRMVIIQNGASELTIYKCDKCKTSIDVNSVKSHIETCNVNAHKFFCRICNVAFTSATSRNEHETNHNYIKTPLKSYRIVIFNREEDKVFNRNISKTKHYVLFECRYCHVVVDKNTYNNHECNHLTCKSCNICGLLLQQRDYDEHMTKHKILYSFNKNYIKVILIGDKNVNGNENGNNLISTFGGMVCDYTFYKCNKCNVCVRDFRNTTQHYCLIDAAILKCPQCELSFDEGKMKGHLKLHDNDPDFTKDTITLKSFSPNQSYKEGNNDIGTGNKESNSDLEVEIIISGDVTEDISPSEPIATIYKCYCGLHFINATQIKDHKKSCSGIVRFNKSRQNCLKCGLTFSSNVLFKHLLEHHRDKNNIFKYEIVDSLNIRD